jgi:hypothetical protein
MGMDSANLFYRHLNSVLAEYSSTVLESIYYDPDFFQRRLGKIKKSLADHRSSIIEDHAREVGMDLQELFKSTPGQMPCRWFILEFSKRVGITTEFKDWNGQDGLVNGLIVSKDTIQLNSNTDGALLMYLYFCGLGHHYLHFDNELNSDKIRSLEATYFGEILLHRFYPDQYSTVVSKFNLGTL